jgi:hypothetical protein
MTANPDRAGEPDPTDVADRIRQAATVIVAHGQAALDRSYDWTPSPISNGPGDNNRRAKGDHSDPTANTALDPRPPGLAGTWHHELVQNLEMLNQLAHDTQILIGRITAVADLEELAERLRQPGAGYCACCTEWVPGTPDNRIVKGFCPSCRRAYDRRGDGSDRSDFIHRHRDTHTQETT